MRVNAGCSSLPKSSDIFVGQPCPSVRKFKLDRFDEFAASLSPRDALVTTLGTDDFSFDATSVRLGQVTVVTGRNSPLLVQASVPPDVIWVVFPLCGAHVRINGRAWSPGLVTVHGAGAMHLGAAHSPAHWAVLMWRGEELEQILSRMPAITGRGGGTATFTTDVAGWERAKALFKSIGEVAASEPDVFDVDEARRSLRAQLRDTLFELLEGASGSKKASLLRGSRGREQVIRALDNHLREHPNQVRTGADLARDLLIPEPRLRSALRATFGIGLSRYVLIHRLLALHAAVVDRGADLQTRRTLATAHGFWNLGILEREYSALFKQPFLAVPSPG